MRKNVPMFKCHREAASSLKRRILNDYKTRQFSDWCPLTTSMDGFLAQ